ncbi:MAG: hypothetical protein ACR2O8_17395 [Rhizobiaceae bacterium]
MQIQFWRLVEACYFRTSKVDLSFARMRASFYDFTDGEYATRQWTTDYSWVGFGPFVIAFFMIFATAFPKFTILSASLLALGLFYATPRGPGMSF